MMAILQDMKTHENLHIIIIKGTIFDALKLWIVIAKYVKNRREHKLVFNKKDEFKVYEV